MKFNPLLFYMNTSDYEDIKNELKKIPCDKFITHYFPYPHPHNLAREHFLSHPEYTHLIIMAHDVICKYENFVRLQEVIMHQNYDVYAAVCNVEQPGHRLNGVANVCYDLPGKDPNKRYFHWIPFGLKGIHQVKHQGNALTCLSRSIIERRNIEGSYFFQGYNNRDPNVGIAPDLAMSHKLAQAMIPIYADFDNQLIHYANHKASKVGVNMGKTEFIPYNP